MIVLNLMMTSVAEKAIPKYAVTRKYFQNNLGNNGMASSFLKLWRKEKATGIMIGKEKKAIRGQI